MIMEELFDQGRLSLSKSGFIWNVRETDMSETDVRTISQEVCIDKRIYFLNAAE